MGERGFESAITKRQAHRKEADRLKKIDDLDNKFNNLISRFDEKKQSVVREFLTPARVLGAEKSILDLERFMDLQDENPRLYSKVFPVYLDFIKELAGLK